MHNLSDLYFSIGNKKEAESGFNELSKKTTNYPVSNIFNPERANEFIKNYNDTINKNAILEIRAQQNNGTIIITKDCDGAIEPVINGLSTINLKKYNVFSDAKQNDSGNTVYYDTYDELGEKDKLYKIDVFSIGNYVSGKEFRLYHEKELQYRNRLYKRLLSDKEKHMLSSLPYYQDGYQMVEGNINMLFTGVHRFGYFDKHPECKLTEQLPYVNASDYREIINIGDPFSVIVNYLAVYGGKLVFQEVTARKYIKSIRRFCNVPTDMSIYGSGNVKNDERIVKYFNNNNIYNENEVVMHMSGKAYKGTMKVIIKELYRENLSLEKKYYIDGNSFELWKDNKTGKTLFFINQLLDNVT